MEKKLLLEKKNKCLRFYIKMSKEIERLEAAIDRLYGIIHFEQKFLSYYDHDYDEVTYDPN